MLVTWQEGFNNSKLLVKGVWETDNDQEFLQRLSYQIQKWHNLNAGMSQVTS